MCIYIYIYVYIYIYIHSLTLSICRKTPFDCLRPHNRKPNAIQPNLVMEKKHQGYDQERSSVSLSENVPYGACSEEPVSRLTLQPTRRQCQDLETTRNVNGRLHCYTTVCYTFLIFKPRPRLHRDAVRSLRLVRTNRAAAARLRRNGASMLLGV